MISIYNKKNIVAVGNIYDNKLIENMRHEM